MSAPAIRVTPIGAAEVEAAREYFTGLHTRLSDAWKALDPSSEQRRDEWQRPAGDVLAGNGRLSVIEHPIEPRSVAAPMHTHTREDEFSFVTRGEVTFQLADEIIVARPGDFVLKPRGIPHAFWNASDEPCAFLELISPAGFENFFRAIGKLWDPEREPDFEKFYALAEEYDLKIDMTDATRYTYDRATGLFREVSNDRRISSGVLKRLDKVSIQLVSPPKR